MSPLSDAERHAKLLALEEWLTWQLQDTRRKIQSVEAQLRQPSYILEKELHQGHPLGVTIHLADCTMADRETRPITADLARDGLTKDAGFFTSCEFCDPGKSLGIEKAPPTKKRSGGMS